jgi:hypothetical protein
VEWSGVEWSTLEKDLRWIEDGLMWSADGLHGLHGDQRWTPRGSMGECKIQRMMTMTIWVEMLVNFSSYCYIIHTAKMSARNLHG